MTESMTQYFLFCNHQALGCSKSCWQSYGTMNCSFPCRALWQNACQQEAILVSTAASAQRAADTAQEVNQGNLVREVCTTG